jgi:hypothetical protein
MSQLVWSYNQLVRSTKSEDPEVRYWAIDRLIRHFPTECPSAIAPFLLDEHDATPSVVARHLGAHGNARHHAILVRGFRLLRGVTPGHCLQALTRLGYPGVVDLAASALKRGDLNEPALAFIVEALADQGTPAARELIRRYISRKIELLAEPATMRGVLRVVDTAEIPTVLSRFLTALQWRGSHRAGEVFRTLMDTLKIDDASWCFRTGPGGHIELRKTIKAVESGYDCDIDSAIGKRTINQIAQRLRAGDLGDTMLAIAEWTEEASRRFPREAGDDLPARIAAAVSAFTRKDVLGDVERLGHQVQQWLLGFQLSAAFAVARAQNFDLSLKRARGQLDRLLDLAAEETSFLVAELPSAIALVCREAPDKARSRSRPWASSGRSTSSPR